MPVVWGESDCSAWAAAWVLHSSGEILNMPTWRSEAEARALIKEFGSLSSLWSEVIDEDSGNAMLEGHGEPLAGDVGIIETHLCGEVGGIFLSHRNFAWRADAGGFRLIRPRLRNIVKFWRLPCDR